jgi:hypothetical protein
VTGELADFGGHPVPANLDAVRSLRELLVGTADTAATINRLVDGIAGSADSGVWSGESAEAFRAKLRDLPKLVGKVERSYGDAAEAVRVFLVAVDQVRSDADAASGQARAAVDQRDAAAVLDPVAPDTPAHVATATQAVADMTARVTALRGDYVRAETVLIDALGVAKSEGIPPDSFWHKLVVVVEEWTFRLGDALFKALVIVVIAFVLVAAAATSGVGILFILGAALELFGPVFAALTVLGAAHLAAGADHKLQYGDDGSAPSWTSLGVETAFMVVPFGVGKTVKRAAPFRAEGSRVGAALDEIADGAQAFREADGGIVIPSFDEVGASVRKRFGPGEAVDEGAMKVEADAVRYMEDVDREGGGHAFSRHGLETTPEQHLDRTKNGMTPDGKQGQPSDSARFFSAADQVDAIEQAKILRSQTGNRKNSISFDMGRDIGEGYIRSADSLDDIMRTTNVKIVFNKNGTIKTAYPLLSPLP